MGKNKSKKSKVSKTVNGVVVDVRVTVPFERLEGELKAVNANGVTIKVKRPRSSKEDLVFVPSADVVAYAKGGGKKGLDLVIVRSPASVLLQGKAESFKEGDKPKIILDGVEWVLNPSNCQVVVKQPL